jgi:hypothetical protein
MKSPVSMAGKSEVCVLLSQHQHVLRPFQHHYTIAVTPVHPNVVSSTSW